MRGPEENTKSSQLEEPDMEGDTCNEGTPRRDPCSSPPCKRLKQGVINFQSVPKQCLPSSVMLTESITRPDEASSSNVGGLVMASASPTDKDNSFTSECDDDDDDVMIVDAKEVEKSSPKSQASPNQVSSTSNHQTPVHHLSSAEKKKRREERQNLKEAKRKEREEKIKQREQAKAVKEKERLKAKQRKEQEKQEKLAEKERKEKDRLEKKMKEEKEKQEKKEKREEERRKKEEEQNAKLEEKRKKEEERKQQEEEMERKKLKARNSFKSFFTKTPSTTPKTLPKSVLKFEPFEIKPNMRLAPRFRSEICKESKEKLDVELNEQAKSNLYLQNLQTRKPLQPYMRVRRRKSGKMPQMDTTAISTNSNHTEPTVVEVIDDEEEDDNSESSSVEEIPDDDKKTAYMKAIFLKFYENNRPPYYGTQRKRSKIISPKNPFKKDEAMLSYEVDSDDEWEEEEPGESLSDSEPEDNNEEENEDCDEEDEDGWMVPHGYLSDDEGIHEDDEEQDNNTVAKKEQQLAKAKAWEAELKKRCKAMKPVCIGCVWDDQKDISDVLKRFEACLLIDAPSISVSLPTSVILDDVQKGNASLFTSPDAGGSTAMFVPEEAMPDLIQLIHESTDGLDKLVNTFQLHWSNKCNHSGDNLSLKGKGQISKRQLSKKIRAIAKKESRLFEKSRWFVTPSVLASYGLEDLKAEFETHQPINGSVIPSDNKQFKRPGTETTKPNALPLNNTNQVVKEPQRVESIHSTVSAPKRRINLERVIPVDNVSNTAVSVSLQSPMERCATKIPNTHSTNYPNQMQTFQGNNHEILSKNAELQLVTFKRQIPSPESTVRGSKVLKMEDNMMNNSNFNNFTVSC